jgi:CBS domain-containing protein
LPAGAPHGAANAAMPTTGEAMRIDLDNTTIRRFPHAFINKRGEAVLIRTLDDKAGRQLLRMYLAYEPRPCFSGLPPAADEACVQWVQHVTSTAANLVALSFEKGLVGHAALFCVDGQTCELLVVVARPEQRIGIGTELTRCAIQLADEIGFESIALHVEASNHVARHVYEKAGFEYRTRGLTDEVDMSLNLRRHRRLGGATVGEIMQADVVTVRPETPCAVALGIFLADRITTLPVVSDSNEIVGILSQTDLLVEANLHKAVREVFTRTLVSVRPECPLAQVISLFRSRKLRCIPVVDRRARLVGVVSRRDILAHYLQQA